MILLYRPVWSPTYYVAQISLEPVILITVLNESLRIKGLQHHTWYNYVYTTPGTIMSGDICSFTISCVLLWQVISLTVCAVLLNILREPWIFGELTNRDVNHHTPTVQLPYLQAGIICTGFLQKSSLLP